MATQRHIPALDGIRGIAVLFVTIFHFHNVLGDGTGPERFLYHALEFGWSGVDLFFVLSGFLITGILIESRNSPTYFSTFYARRSLRIFPLYYGFLAAIFLLHHVYLIVPQVRFGAIPWWWYVFYVSNWKMGGLGPHVEHLWSLALEEQFYLFWPLLVRLTAPKHLKTLCLTLALTAFLLRCLLINHVPASFLYQTTFMRLDPLALGGFMAVAIRDEHLRRIVRRLALPGMAIAICVFAAVVIADRSFTWGPAMTTVGAFSLAVLYALFVFTAADSKETLARLLSARWLRSLGKYSYAMYVFHPLLFGLTNVPVQRMLGGLPVYPRMAVEVVYVPVMILVTFGVAKLSWILFESPILRLKRHFPYSPGPAHRVELAAEIG